MPNAIVDRPLKTPFNGAVVRWGHASLIRILGVLEGPTWLSGELVDQRVALNSLKMLAQKAPDALDWAGWRAIRSIVNIEMWQRAVLGYSAARENLSMSEVKEPLKEREDEAAAELTRELPYVPPKLTGVGNIHELLAGGLASGTDEGQAHTFG
jgi:hypothetical protein